MSCQDLRHPQGSDRPHPQACDGAGIHQRLHGWRSAPLGSGGAVEEDVKDFGFCLTSRIQMAAYLWLNHRCETNTARK